MARIYVALILLLSVGVSWADSDFSLLRVQVGSQKLTVEVAETDAQRARGLMFRTKLKEDRGMLFVFEQMHRPTFWMKNTLIPLAIGFFDEQLVLVDIQEMVPASTLELEPTRYTSRKSARLALEVNQGWFDRHKVKLGDRLRFLHRPRSKSLQRLNETH